MNKKETRPFRPYVTLEQVYAFDKDRPATYTGSPLVDTVLSLFGDPRFSNSCEISHYLELSTHDISTCLRVATGHKLSELRRLWAREKAEKFKAAHPHCTDDDMAHALGFRDHSTLWHMLHAEEENRKQNARRHRNSGSGMNSYFHREEE